MAVKIIHLWGFDKGSTLFDGRLWLGRYTVAWEVPWGGPWMCGGSRKDRNWIVGVAVRRVFGVFLIRLA